MADDKPDTARILEQIRLGKPLPKNWSGQPSAPFGGAAPEKTTVSEAPPETPTHAARVLIGWFAGGLAFQCVENLHSGLWPSLGYGVGAVAVAAFDYKLPTILARSPHLTKSLNSVAADARLWTAVAMLSLLIIALSPYAEQHRWPFAWQLVSPAAPTPTESLFTQAQVNEKISKATAAIQKQLDDVIAEQDSANSRVRQLEASQKAPPASPVAAEGPRVFTDKTKEQIWNTYCEGRTELQCSILMNEEKNKWITIPVIVALIHAGGNVEFNSGIICSFGGEWLPALGTFRGGDHMTITGQIVGFNVRFFILQKCEIKSPS